MCNIFRPKIWKNGGYHASQSAFLCPYTKIWRWVFFFLVHFWLFDIWPLIEGKAQRPSDFGGKTRLKRGFSPIGMVKKLCTSNMPVTSFYKTYFVNLLRSKVWWRFFCKAHLSSDLLKNFWLLVRTRGWDLINSHFWWLEKIANFTTKSHCNTEQNTYRYSISFHAFKNV